MPTREARTDWTGSLEQGSGQVELVSSGLASYQVSFAKRAADEARGATSPEELVAAAHSACYAMQFSALVAEAGGTPERVTAAAEVSLGPDPAGGFHLTGITLRVQAHVGDLDPGRVAQVAEAAKASCPVSKALTGVEITLDFAAD